MVGAGGQRAGVRRKASVASCVLHLEKRHTHAFQVGGVDEDVGSIIGGKDEEADTGSGEWRRDGRQHPLRGGGEVERTHPLPTPS